MTFKMPELACLIVAINNTKDGKTRTFTAVQLPVVVDVMKKVRALGDESGNIPPGDHELEFSTDEKKFVRDLMEDHEWPAGDAEAVLHVIELLK